MSDINLFRKPLEPDEEVVAYHDGINFTRFFGSLACDQPLLLVVSFSNDEVGPDGDYVTDETMPYLNYDAEAIRHVYDPAKQGTTGRYFLTIYGRFVRAVLKNTGTKPTTFCRIFLRGSVF